MSLLTHQSSITSLTNLNTTIQPYQEKPGEIYMNARQKAHLRRILEEERAYWVEIQNRIVSDFLQKKTDRLSSDPVDIANREIEMRYAVRGREHRLIKKIDKALARLEAQGNQYGFCDFCQAEIGIKRLEIRPTANLCFDCKTLDEIHEKQSGNT